MFCAAIDYGCQEESDDEDEPEEATVTAEEMEEWKAGSVGYSKREDETAGKFIVTRQTTHT